MAKKITNNHATVRLSSIRAVLGRWGFPPTVVATRLAPLTTRARRPGASEPVYIEDSPAKVDPFPEPKTIPDGWDMSEIA